MARASDLELAHSLLDTVMYQLHANGIERYAVLKGGYMLQKMLQARGTREYTFPPEMTITKENPLVNVEVNALRH